MPLGGAAEMSLPGKLQDQAEETNPRKVQEDPQFSPKVLKTVEKAAVGPSSAIGPPTRWIFSTLEGENLNKKLIIPNSQNDCG